MDLAEKLFRKPELHKPLFEAHLVPAPNPCTCISPHKSKTEAFLIPKKIPLTGVHNFSSSFSISPPFASSSTSLESGPWTAPPKNSSAASRLKTPKPCWPSHSRTLGLRTAQAPRASTPIDAEEATPPGERRLGRAGSWKRVPASMPTRGGVQVEAAPSDLEGGGRIGNLLNCIGTDGQAPKIRGSIGAILTGPLCALYAGRV